VIFLRHSYRAVVGKRHSCFKHKKTRKEAVLLVHSRTFRVFQILRLFNLWPFPAAHFWCGHRI